jgi:hypothetical protein
MADTRGWILAAAAVVLLAAGGAAGYLLGSDSDSESGTTPPAAVERTVTEDQVVTTTTTHRERPAEPPGWRGGGYPVVGVERGSKLPVRSSPGGETVKRFGAKTEFGSPRVLWVAKRRGPWLGVVASELGNDRLGWMRYDERRLRFGTTPYSLRVDLTDRTVELRRGDRTVRRVVVSVGRIGSGTPPGRFAVTDIITRGLSDVYGCCAIALSARQPNLPPGWIGGDRIAVHGWNGPVGDSASGGCLRASNRDIRWLARHVQLGTPAFIKT